MLSKINRKWTIKMQVLENMEIQLTETVGQTCKSPNRKSQFCTHVHLLIHTYIPYRQQLQ